MLSSALVLWLQVVLGVMLGVGAVLARRGFHRAHGACQATAYVLTLVLTAAWMVPVFVRFFAPNVLRMTVERADVIATVHAVLGTAVLLLGAYVVLVAGTSVVPARWRFTSYRPWMRTLLALWWGEILLGIWTYWVST